MQSIGNLNPNTVVQVPLLQLFSLSVYRIWLIQFSKPILKPKIIFSNFRKALGSESIWAPATTDLVSTFPPITPQLEDAPECMYPTSPLSAWTYFLHLAGSTCLLVDSGRPLICWRFLCGPRNAVGDHLWREAGVRERGVSNSSLEWLIQKKTIFPDCQLHFTANALFRFSVTILVNLLNQSPTFHPHTALKLILANGSNFKFFKTFFFSCRSACWTKRAIQDALSCQEYVSNCSWHVKGSMQAPGRLYMTYMGFSLVARRGQVQRFLSAMQSYTGSYTGAF